MCITRRGRREEKTLHLAGKDRLEKVKTLERASLGLRLTNALPSEERLQKIFFGGQTRKEKEGLVDFAYDLILRLKPGNGIDAGVPKKSCWKG